MYQRGHDVIFIPTFSVFVDTLRKNLITSHIKKSFLRRMGSFEWEADLSHVLEYWRIVVRQIGL